MGEWSDYFEDFPEENPADYINGHFSPPGASLQGADGAGYDTFTAIYLS